MEAKSYPEPVVGVLIFNEENKIFLVSSSKWQGKYCIPGGHVEIGETVEQTAKREIKEETNLDIFDFKFLQIQDCIFSEEFHKKKHFIALDCFCKTKSKDIILNEEGTDYVWVNIEEALDLNLSSYTKNTILEYQRKFL